MSTGTDRERTIADATCLACGCLCDDIVLSVSDNRITARGMLVIGAWPGYSPITSRATGPRRPSRAGRRIGPPHSTGRPTCSPRRGARSC